jgi:hypothetical protein
MKKTKVTPETQEAAAPQQPEQNRWKVISRPVKKDVRVDATEPELLDRGRLVAELATERQKIEAEKKAAAEEFKSELEANKAQLDATFEELRSGKVLVRSADCVEEWDPHQGMYFLRWGDRIVEQREMNTDERRNYSEGIFDQKSRAAGEKEEDPGADDEDFIDADWERNGGEGSSTEDITAVIKAETNPRKKKGIV